MAPPSLAEWSCCHEVGRLASGGHPRFREEIVDQRRVSSTVAADQPATDGLARAPKQRAHTRRVQCLAGNATEVVAQDPRSYSSLGPSARSGLPSCGFG